MDCIIEIDIKLSEEGQLRYMDGYAPEVLYRGISLNWRLLRRSGS